MLGGWICPSVDWHHFFFAMCFAHQMILKLDRYTETDRSVFFQNRLLKATVFYQVPELFDYRCVLIQLIRFYL